MFESGSHDAFLVATAEMTKAGAEALLSFPGQIEDFFGLTVLSQTKDGSDTSGHSIMPCSLNER